MTSNFTFLTSDICKTQKRFARLFNRFGCNYTTRSQPRRAAMSRVAGAQPSVGDNQPGASPDNLSWAGNQIEVNVFIYGYESVWLPASLLEQQDRLADTLFASTRHFEVQSHFNKGLAGAP